MEPPLYLALFTLAAITLKLADDTGEAGRRTPSYLFAATSALLFWALISGDAFASTFLSAIVLGCLLSLKIDRPNLIFGSVMLLVLVGVLGAQTPHLGLLALFSGLVLLDEKLHDLSHRGGAWSRPFMFRPLLKLSALPLLLTGWVSPLNVLGLLIFDLSYEALGGLLNIIPLISLPTPLKRLERGN